MKDITRYITEYVSSGRNTRNYTGVPKNRTDRDKILAFLGMNGFREYTGDMKGMSMSDLCIKLRNTSKHTSSAIYWIDEYSPSDPDTWNILFAKKGNDYVFKINTSREKQDIIDRYDPNNPICSYFVDGRDVYFYGYKDLDELFEEVEKEFDI